MIAHSACRTTLNGIRAALIAVAVLLLTITSGQQDTAAKAPPLAVALVDTHVYATPDVFGPSLGIMPGGLQVELTGEAAPGFIAVYYAGEVVWVPAHFLSVSDRPGIDTAVALVDTALLEAPRPEAGVVTEVPEGAAVILTGASVGGYDAASYDGAGGWLDAGDIAQ